MKRQSRTMRLGVLALTLTMITTCLTGGTLARYVTEVTGTATATVAKWSFTANDSTAEKTKFTAIDMGATRTSYVEGDIKDGVIAPGTTGSFEIVIDGTGSEVGIDYEVKIAAADKTTLPSDLVFSTAEITDAAPGKSIDDLMSAADSGLKGTIDYGTGADAMKKTITVYWSWDFGKNDSTASNDNTYQAADWTLNITATGKQTELATK